MLLCSPPRFDELTRLLGRYGLTLVRIPDGASIPGSYWGEPEAGLLGETVTARADTPVHSVLHETSHAICMNSERRARLHTDAGGDYAEENAVCYLQMLLAQTLNGVTLEDVGADMDAWGYTFRLGSALAWFERDADDARAWLRDRGLLTAGGKLPWKGRAE